MVVMVNKKVNVQMFNWSNINLLHESHISSRPPDPHFLLSYIKGRFLPALAPNVGIGRKSWNAESSDMDIIPRDTGLEKENANFWSSQCDCCYDSCLQTDQKSEYDIKWCRIHYPAQLFIHSCQVQKTHIHTHKHTKVCSLCFLHFPSLFND